MSAGIVATHSPPAMVALCGYAGAGKDSAALALVKAGWRRVAFGDALRDFALAADPIAAVVASAPVRLSALVADLGWESAKRTHPEVRAVLQRIGTDAARTVLGEDVWARAALAGVGANERVVITDLRARSDAAALVARGAVIVRVVRPGVGPVNGHPGEVELDDHPFDHVIVNEGSLTDLHAKVVVALGL